MAKIVFESLFEFERGQNPSQVLDLGRKEKMIKWLSEWIPYSRYKINNDWTIDLPGGLVISSNRRFESFPEFIKIDVCHGDFLIRDQLLNSMIGCPRIVEGDFFVDGNKLEDLDGSPEEVHGCYYIRKNKKKFTKEEIQAVCKVGENIVV